MRNSLIVEFRVILEHSNNTLTDLITNSLDYPVELSFFHKMAPSCCSSPLPHRHGTEAPAGPVSSASMVLLQKLLLLTAADSSALVLTAATAHALAAG